MRGPFWLREQLRRPFTTLLLFLLGAMFAGLLCGLLAAEVNMERQARDVYEDSPVRCQVTNLTGTRTESLQLPNWVSNLFLGDWWFSDNADEERFRSYVTDVQSRFSLGGTLGTEDAELCALTSLAAAWELQPLEGAVIRWRDGYDETMFGGDEALCVVPERLANVDEITVALTNNLIGEEDLPVTLRVAGVYYGVTMPEDCTVFYVPWAVGSSAAMQLNGIRTVTSLSARIRDNHTIDEFRDEVVPLFFTTPDPAGKAVKWPDGYADTYPYALIIHDEQMLATVASLTRTRQVYRLCAVAVVPLVLVLYVVVCHLILRHRERQLALMQVMGEAKSTIFLRCMGEEAGVSLLGVLSGTVCAAIMGCEPPWTMLAALTAANIIGTAGAAIVFLRKDLIRALKGAE